jgi:hypothetical protein
VGARLNPPASNISKKERILEPIDDLSHFIDHRPVRICAVAQSGALSPESNN